MDIDFRFFILDQRWPHFIIHGPGCEFHTVKEAQTDETVKSIFIETLYD